MRSAIRPHIERKLMFRFIVVNLHPAIDRFEDPWRLIDPSSLAAGHFDQIAAFNQGIDRGVGRRACRAEQLLGSGGGDNRHREQVLRVFAKGIRTSLY